MATRLFRIACFRLLTPYFTPPPRLFADFTPPPRRWVMAVKWVIALLFIVVTKNFLDNPPSSLSLNLTRKGDWEGGTDAAVAIIIFSYDKQEGDHPLRPLRPPPIYSCG